MRLRDQLRQSSLVDQSKSANSADIKACKEVSRCMWFFRDSLNDGASMDWNDGFKTVKLLEKIGQEAMKDDEGI